MKAKRYNLNPPLHVLKCQRKNKRHPKNCYEAQQKKWKAGVSL